MKKLFSRPMIAWILLGAAVLRGLAAMVSLGFDHPNEIFRMFEPIALAEGYSGKLPFEWTDQLLSWIPVRFFDAFLRGASFLGIRSSRRSPRSGRTLF